MLLSGMWGWRERARARQRQIAGQPPALLTSTTYRRMRFLTLKAAGALGTHPGLETRWDRKNSTYRCDARSRRAPVGQPPEDRRIFLQPGSAGETGESSVRERLGNPLGNRRERADRAGSASSSPPRDERSAPSFQKVSGCSLAPGRAKQRSYAEPSRVRKSPQAQPDQPCRARYDLHPYSISSHRTYRDDSPIGSRSCE
jgi:hypothetical protein